MAEISRITLPSGTSYDLKDAQARNDISNIQSTITGAMHYKGITTTALTDGSTTATITIDGESTTLTSANAGAVVIYAEKEYVWNGSKWQEFGSTGSLKALAFKDSASASYTPAGTVTSTFTGSEQDVTITATNDANGNYQPAGTVSVSTESTTNKTTTVSAAASGTTTYQPSGTVSVDAYTPEGSVGLNKTSKTFTISKAQSGTTTFTPEGAVTQPTFSGSSMTSTGNFTPSGNVTIATASTGTSNYTPEGTISAPTISVATAGSTTTIKNPTSVTVAKTVVAAAPGATAPSNNLTYYSVSGETLSLYQIGYTTGDSITTSNVTVKNGDASYTASTPTFTGTDAVLTANFTGTQGSVSVSGTPEGTVSQPTFNGTAVRLEGSLQTVDTASFTGTEKAPTGSFSGTAVRLVTGNIPVPSAYNASFTGTKVQLDGTVTPSGSVSSTFNGTAATITVT